MKKLLVSSENAEFQIIESLKTSRSKRSRHNEIFIEGIESIKQVLKSGLEITRIITTDKISSWAHDIIGKIGINNEIKIIEMTETLYAKLCDKNVPSEMLVTAKMPKLTLSTLKLPEYPFIIVMDRSSDTGNLGSIIRSANSFGVDAVLLAGHGVDPWDPKTIRASLGSIFFTVPVQAESMEELAEFVRKFRIKNHLYIWGTDSLGSVPLNSVTLKRPLMLILGNEAKGISQSLKSLCDGILSIPLSGNVNSLNIAGAAGIFMWEVLKNEN